MYSNKTKKQKENEIWLGIVRKAQLDNDYSLDQVNSGVNISLVQNIWVRIAALLFVVFSFSLIVTRLWHQDNFLKEEDMSLVFADTSSVSRLITSSGDTVFFDNGSALAQLKGNAAILDFRNIHKIDLHDNNQIVEAGRGRLEHIILNDGTKVWLNASSRIEFPTVFSKETREVKVSGEVYFEVAHNSKHPFVVKTKHESIKVLGTHFNTRAYSGESYNAITLLEGRVEVTENSGKAFLLKPSEQYVSLRNTEKSIVREIEDVEMVVAWKDGEFYFKDADALTIINELERWYPVRILLKNEVKRKTISGKIKRTDSLKEVVDMLRFFEIEIEVQMEK